MSSNVLSVLQPYGNNFISPHRMSFTFSVSEIQIIVQSSSVCLKGGIMHPCMRYFCFRGMSDVAGQSTQECFDKLVQYPHWRSILT